MDMSVLILVVMGFLTSMVAQFSLITAAVVRQRVNAKPTGRHDAVDWPATLRWPADGSFRR